MGRLIAFLTCLASPVTAWEFTPVPFCTLEHVSESGQIVLIYDHTTKAYAIALTLASGTWGVSPGFSIAFIGERSLRIGTDRHQLSNDGATLTVTDSGFGNVLDGLQFNNDFVAVTDKTIMDVRLDGAAEPVAAFRACGEAALS